MKRKLALFMACLLAFTACTKQTESGTSDENFAIESQTVAESSNVIPEKPTVSADNTTSATAPVQTDAGMIPLSDATIAQLESANIIAEKGDLKYYDGFVLSSSTKFYYDNTIEILNDTQDRFKLRFSSGALYTNDISDSPINSILKSASYSDTKIAESSQYKYMSFSNPTMELNGYSDDHSKIKVLDMKFYYTIYNMDTSLNAFVAKSGEYYKIIIDPAYMRGIPMFAYNSDDLTFDINGTKIQADTMALTAYGKYVKTDYEPEESKYVYAKVSFDYIDPAFAINSEAESTASIDEIKLITEDTDKVLSEPYSIIQKQNSDPEMSKTYNAIMDNIDEFYNENTVGINLLDLDFDGTPELIVSDITVIDDAWDSKIDSKIYSLKDGKLQYIDTLYNKARNIYDNGNILGLKTLEDGSKAWFTISRTNRSDGKEYAYSTEYLFTLTNNKLKFTEVFSYGYDSLEETNGVYSGKVNKIYFMGKEIVPEIEYKQDDYFGDEPVPVYTYDGMTSWFGLWELGGWLKAKYCNDMENSTYDLNSYWLSNLDKAMVEYPFELKFVDMTDRMMSYNIAYLVDAFYLGEYDSTLQKYEYRFLGDYAKPVIYLYPEEKTDIHVEVNLNGELTCTYPDYNGGWNVTAYPDGKLINHSDSREYPYLFWEGKAPADWDFSSGFVIKGEDTLKFLQEKLAYMGLTDSEANDFIVYWLPQMCSNSYNLITFQTEKYEENARLNISPAPDSMLRIFMVFTPLEKPVFIPEQKLEQFERKGFAVVEWGGSEFINLEKEVSN